MNDFEEVVKQLTLPLNGQYPRPWMTKLADPTQAKVFIVGKNQAKGYLVEKVGSHSRHMDALFNRNGQSCRGLYGEVTGGSSSQTRKNIEGLTSRLERLGVSEVLETNVICYSTPMSSDLSRPRHEGGRTRGREIFQTLLDFVHPKVLIVYGAGASQELSKVLKKDLPKPPSSSKEFPRQSTEISTVFVIRSLAPPAFNTWSAWAEDYLDLLAQRVAHEVRNASAS